MEGVEVHRFSVAGSALSGCSGELERYVAFVAGGHWDVIAMHCSQTWSTDLLLSHLSKIDCAKVFVAHGMSVFGKKGTEPYFETLAAALRGVTMVSLARGLEDDKFCTSYELPAPVVIPNGVDTALWKSPSCWIREKWHIQNRPWLVSVSNHNPNKGHQDLFRLVDAVRQEVPAVYATIIGKSYGAAKWRTGELGIKGGCWYRCRLRALLNGNVQLFANIQRDQVISAIKEADVMVCTSSWEASPLSILEAMAAGIPWVSKDVGAVRDHAGGLVVNSIEEMREAVVGLLRDPERRKALGREGAARIAAAHNWDDIAQRYQSLYLSVSSERAGA
jgi:glycosyltransferase involved in cell wall biosynthesis